MGKYFLMKHQKSVTSVYSALYREKLCNYCIQVDDEKMTPSLSETTATSIDNVF